MANTTAQTRALSASSPNAPLLSAASLRAPMRDEILPIAVTSTAKVCNVPVGAANQPDWRDRIVNFYAEDVAVYLQFSTGVDADADEAARATEVLASGRVTLTKSSSGKDCWKIPADQWVPIPVPASVQTFAVKTKNGTAVLRTAIAET